MTDARALEQLRQERKAFDQAKAHEARWFTLRLTIGYAGIGLLFVIALMSGYILLHPGSYATATIGIAATALLVDIVGLVASIFKLVLQQGNAIQLKPATAIHPDIR